MQIRVGAVSTDLSYEVFFEEPRYELFTLEGQIKWLGYFRKQFSLSLNDVRVNRETSSNNFLHFSKAYGKTFIDVSYGLEQVHASISNPSQSEQLSRPSPSHIFMDPSSTPFFRQNSWRGEISFLLNGVVGRAGLEDTFFPKPIFKMSNKIN